MRVKGSIKAKLLGKKSNEFNGKNYYQLAILTPELEAGNVSVTEDVFKHVKEGLTYNLSFNLNTDNFNGLFITSVEEVK